MSHPTVWMAQTMFYPMGNTPAISLTQDLAPEQDADILQLGCGDPRNILFTLHSDVTSGGPRKLDITCCDMESAILARNVLLFALIEDNESTERIWDLFYHFNINPTASKLLVTSAAQLAHASSSLAEWGKSKYNAFLKVIDARTLSALHSHFTSYSDFPTISSTRLQKLRQQQTELSKKCASQYNMSASRSAGILWNQAMRPIAALFQRYWKTGTTFSEEDADKVKDATELNPTFVYSMAGERFNPHYGTFPQGFHLAPAFAPVLSDSPSPVNSMDVAKRQFKEWCDAFRQSRASNAIVIRYFTGEALAFCRALNILARTNQGKSGLFAAPWSASQIDFSNCKSMPTSFDVIDTSNLMDHLGTINLLVATQPLLKQDPASQAVVYTETLLPSAGSATQSFAERLCAEVPTMALLLGLAPRPYLAGFSSQSNMHELIMLSALEEVSQYHDRVVWVVPTSGDPHAHNKLLPLSFKASEITPLLFSIHKKMFMDESMSPQQITNPTLKDAVSMSEAHYHRETFAIMLQHIQGRFDIVDSNWDHAIDYFLRLVMGDQDTILGMNHYQDLCLQLHLYGVHTVPSLSPNWRSVKRYVPSDEAIFADWENVPAVVCVVMAVPREKLKCLMPEEAGSPRLQGNIWTGTAYHNVFSSLCCVWGKLVSSAGASGFTIEEDLSGVHGTSDLIVSFWTSSYVLVAADTTVGLSLRLNPISLAGFSSKLGSNLELFTVNLRDKGHIHVLRDWPIAASEVQQVIQLSTGHSTASRVWRPLSEHAEVKSERGEYKVTSLTARLEIESPDEQAALLNGAKVSAAQISPCAMEVSVGESTHVVTYSYPINGPSSRVRIARKSHYIEAIVPIANPIGTGGYTLNPFPIIQHSAYSPWNLHHIRLERMPMLKIQPGNDLEWLTSHCVLQLSDRERALNESAKDKPENVLVNLKESMYTMFNHYVGISRGPTRVFGLSEPNKGTGIYTIIMVGGIRLDLGSSTLLLDAAVVPLSMEKMPLLLPGIQTLHAQDKGCEQVITRGDEATAWKKLLPAFVERCRTWAHTPNCEYGHTRSVPLSLELERSPICNCGQGIGFEAEQWNVSWWKGLLPFATRAAISPLFAVSYLESITWPLHDAKLAAERRKLGAQTTTDRSNIACWSCGGPGRPDLLSCGKCKKACYCSSACQLQDWKGGHKKVCKPVG